MSCRPESVFLCSTPDLPTVIQAQAQYLRIPKASAKKKLGQFLQASSQIAYLGLMAVSRETDANLTVFGVTRVALRLREHRAGCEPPGMPEKAASACSRSFSLKPWPLKSNSLSVWYHFWVNRELPSLTRVSRSDTPYKPRCSCSSSEIRETSMSHKVGKDYNLPASS